MTTDSTSSKPEQKATESTSPKPAQAAAESASPKSRLATTLLAWFLWWLGVDRFYTGHIGLGILKIVTFGGFGIWGLIDFILAVAGKRKDKKGLLITKW